MTSATDLNTPTPGNLGGNEEASVSDGMVLSVDARFASDAMVLDAATDSDAMVPTVDALFASDAIAFDATANSDVSVGAPEDASIETDAAVVMETLTTGIFSIRQSWVQETNTSDRCMCKSHLAPVRCRF